MMYVYDKQHVHIGQTTCMYIYDKQHVHSRQTCILRQITCPYFKNRMRNAYFILP